MVLYSEEGHEYWISSGLMRDRVAALLRASTESIASPSTVMEACVIPRARPQPIALAAPSTRACSSVISRFGIATSPVSTAPRSAS